MLLHYSLLLSLILIFVGMNKAHAEATYQYNVTVPSNLQSFDVELCFLSKPPARMRIPGETLNRRFHNIHRVVQNKTLQIPVTNRYIDLADFNKGDCLSYTTDFNGQMTHPWFKDRQSTQDQILVALSQWCWQPPAIKNATSLVVFHLPSGFEVSAPGKLIRSSQDKRVYHFRSRPSEWEGRIAVGRFDKVSRKIGLSKVEIAILQGQKTFDHDKITRWVDANLVALLQLYGHMPVEDLQLLIVPVGKDREPVPWGQAMRGGGDAVHVYIDETCTIEEFLDDWVLIHELGHLLHPRLSGDGDWLSEGIASYYQNVLRARSGLLTQEQAWNKLNAGFERGLKQTPPSMTLAQVSDGMRQNRLFMRVYWSGAAISLIADAQLRSSTDNTESLDTVLNKYAKCCLPVDKAWTALQLMQKFDELSNTTIFSELYDKYVPSTQFPDLHQTYQMLGLNKQAGRLEFKDAVANISVRQAIVSKIH